MSKPSGRRRKAPARRRFPVVTGFPVGGGVLAVAAFLVVVSVLAGYLVLSGGDDAAPAGSAAGGAQRKPLPGASGEAAWDGRVEVIGDGSTSYTGPQKGQLEARPLKPGEKPPQFVVFSWDGALQGDDGLFAHYREMANRHDAHMTFFLTGIYLLPKGKKDLYDPPQHDRGSAAISFPRMSTSIPLWSSLPGRGRTGTRSVPTSTGTSVVRRGWRLERVGVEERDRPVLRLRGEVEDEYGEGGSGAVAVRHPS